MSDFPEKVFNMRPLALYIGLLTFFFIFENRQTTLTKITFKVQSANRKTNNTQKPAPYKAPYGKFILI